MVLVCLYYEGSAHTKKVLVYVLSRGGTRGYAPPWHFVRINWQDVLYVCVMTSFFSFDIRGFELSSCLAGISTAAIWLMAFLR